jgi:hypothetical protein
MNDAKIQILQLLGQWVSNPPLWVVRSGYTDRLALLKPRLLKRISKILGRVCVYFLGGAGIPVFWTGIHTRMRGAVGENYPDFD